MTCRTLSFLVFSIIWLSGCTLAPEYVRPEAPVPEAWSVDTQGTADEASRVSELNWSQFYTEKRLQQTIAIAIENNRDLRVASLNVERARAYYRIQRAELLPTIGTTGKAYKERVPADLSSTGSRMTTEEYRAELGASNWEIDFFGRIRSLSQSALEEFFATQQARLSAKILLVSETAKAYLTLAADRENLELARETLTSQQEARDLIRLRYEVGVAPELDLRQVQTQVDAARVTVARLTEVVARDVNALNMLVGTSVPTELLPQSLSDLTPVHKLSPSTSSAVLLNHPDILQAENLLKAANANIGAARAALFPRISLTTSVGTASSELSGLFESGSGAWMFSPHIALPIFDPRAWVALRVTRVEREIAVAQYERAIQAAFREVADTLARRNIIVDQMDAQKSLVASTEVSYRISRARYKKGIDIYLNVLDVQRSLHAAQQGLITIRLADLVNQVRLYAVLGGGSE